MLRVPHKITSPEEDVRHAINEFEETTVNSRGRVHYPRHFPSRLDCKAIDLMNHQFSQK